MLIKTLDNINSNANQNNFPALQYFWDASGIDVANKWCEDSIAGVRLADNLGFSEPARANNCIYGAGGSKSIDSDGAELVGPGEDDFLMITTFYDITLAADRFYLGNLQGYNTWLRTRPAGTSTIASGTYPPKELTTADPASIVLAAGVPVTQILKLDNTAGIMTSVTADASGSEIETPGAATGVWADPEDFRFNITYTYSSQGWEDSSDSENGIYYAAMFKVTGSLPGDALLQEAAQWMRANPTGGIYPGLKGIV